MGIERDGFVAIAETGIIEEIPGSKIPQTELRMRKEQGYWTW
jgi:hypothetical protein